VLHDAADGVTFKHDDRKGFLQFARYAHDTGTDVIDGARAQRYEAGLGFYQPDGSEIQGVLRKLGEYFNPVDGFIPHPDIAGYDIDFYKPFKYATTARFNELDFNGQLDRYHDHTGALDQSDNNLRVSLTTRTQFTLQASTGASYLLLGNTFTPITQQGIGLGYNLDGLLPSVLQFEDGRFGPGRLGSWRRVVSLRAGTRGILTFEGDDTAQVVDVGFHATEWLERATFSYQSGPDQSLALGVRRIIGVAPMLTLGSIMCSSGSTQRVCPPPAVDAWNVSAAFHRTMPAGEIYLAYGDASQFATVPRFIIKYIRYLGAQKGT
jgi:hypothetical protein